MMMSDNIPVRVAVTGATGRMGEEIIRSLVTTQQEYSNKITLGAVVVRVGSDICGMDVGDIIKNSVTGIIITSNLNVVKDDFDVLVDFTAPDASIEYLNFCVNNHKNMVIGTTGFNKDYQCFIKNMSQKIGIVHSSNFSVGVTLMLKLLNMVTKVMGNISDINIIESHHNKKVDVPSGTALMMQDSIVNTLLSSFVNDTEKLHSNIGGDEVLHKLPLSYNIPIHSIRAGNLVGEHNVIFTSAGESLEIAHKVCNRAVFAYGALRSAIWLGSSKKGLFDMCDVLNM